MSTTTFSVYCDNCISVGPANTLAQIVCNGCIEYAIEHIHWEKTRKKFARLLKVNQWVLLRSENDLNLIRGFYRMAMGDRDVPETYPCFARRMFANPFDGRDRRPSPFLEFLYREDTDQMGDILRKAKEQTQ